MEPNGRKKSEAKSVYNKRKYHIKAEMENSCSEVTLTQDLYTLGLGSKTSTTLMKS